MINSLKDLELSEDDTLEMVNTKVNNCLNLSLEDMQISLQNSLQQRCEEVAQDYRLIAPYGDYGKSIEDTQQIAQFLKEEASQSKNWKLQYIQDHETNSNLIQFNFANLSVDEGDSCYGVVLVSKSGKIRHSFVHSA